jgi:deazaflavin-dependent oxidoreductase (nitroreductase family)
MLTSTGARTGLTRTLPVLALPDGDRLVVIASNYGRPNNPGWYYNLVAHPGAVVTWEGSPVQMQARELRGEERRLHVARGLQAYPWWEQYHRRAAPREIPVIMLEPVRTS